MSTPAAAPPTVINFTVDGRQLSAPPGTLLIDACKRAGIVGASPHTLRHTCGTWMAMRGVPLHLIGGWLGHTDNRTTELYAHHHPNHMDAARTAADRR